MAQRGPYAKGVAKREQILEAALSAVAQHGYRKASVREIADAAGLSPAGLLHYFGSKEDLFVDILETRDAREYASPDFMGTFVEIVRNNAAIPGLVHLYAGLSADAADPQHPAHDFFLRRTARLETIACDEIIAAQQTGTIRADLDPAWIARTAHALTDGLQTAWMLDPTIDMAADLEQFLSLLRP